MGCYNISNERKKYKQIESIKEEIINRINYLNNVKNNYIFQKILNNLEMKIKFKIIKYNKKFQKRLSINLKDYKEYCEIYIPIEIEIITNSFTGTFINIEEFKYVHIFFNDNKEEIKRNNLTKNDKVKKIKIQFDYKFESFHKLFYRCYAIKSINFIKFYRTNISNMSYMFYGCYALGEINFSNFKTDNVDNMSHMFEFCSKLKELNLSNFNTSNVNDMSYMFNECSSLKELNLSNFNTKEVEYMNNMFYFCSSLKKINLSNFNTNNVTDMSYMFAECKSLQELNLSKFKTNNVINMSKMFLNCQSLKELNIINFNTSNVIDITDIFELCSPNLKVKMKENLNKRIKNKNPILIII